MLKKAKFQFLDPGYLIDGELELVLAFAYPGDPDLMLVPEYQFVMQIHQGDAYAGRIDLRVGHSDDLEQYSGHVGYSVEPEHWGHRYAARSCKLIFPLAKAHGLNPLWITCDPSNIASRRSCELAGAEYVDTVAIPSTSDLYRQGARFRCRYRVNL